MELIERIAYILENNQVKPGISEYEFAKSLKVSPSKFSEIRSGKVKSISSSLALEISKYYNVDFKWLLTGEGTPFSNKDEDCITLERVHITPSCGIGTVVLDEAEVTPITLGKKLIQNIFRVGNHSNLKVFTATGDSMEPTIFSGDDVLVNIGDCNFNNGGVFVIEKFGDWFIKRLRLRFDGNLEIISDNNKYETEIIKYDSGTVVNIKGRVIKNLSRGL